MLQLYKWTCYMYISPGNFFVWQAVKMIFFAPCSSAEGREKREAIFFVITLAPYLGLAVLVFNGITECAPVFSHL